MKRFIKIIGIVLCVIAIVTGCAKKSELKVEEGIVIESISDADLTYSWNNYKKLGTPSVDILSNNDNIATTFTGDYMLLTPGNVNKYVDIIFPEDMRYPNIDGKYNTDSDGKLYLDPKEFTIINSYTPYKDIQIHMIIANTKDDVQDIENCDIIYIDLIPTTYSKLTIPELEMNLTKDVDIRYAFFKKSDCKTELEDKILLQYSMRNGGLIFVFDKEGKFESLRIFSANSLEGYRYNNLLK